MSKKPLSIAEYERAQRRVHCVVCTKVSAALLKQIKDAKDSRDTTVVTLLAWLREEHGIKITQPQWQRHARGAH